MGLIPFKDEDTLVQVMERPLKFYEYLAAGLGIAATDVTPGSATSVDFVHAPPASVRITPSVQPWLST